MGMNIRPWNQAFLQNYQQAKIACELLIFYFIVFHKKKRLNHPILSLFLCCPQPVDNFYEHCGFLFFTVVENFFILC